MEVVSADLVELWNNHTPQLDSSIEEESSSLTVSHMWCSHKHKINTRLWSGFLPRPTNHVSSLCVLECLVLTGCLVQKFPCPYIWNSNRHKNWTKVTLCMESNVFISLYVGGQRRILSLGARNQFMMLILPHSAEAASFQLLIPTDRCIGISFTCRVCCCHIHKTWRQLPSLTALLIVTFPTRIFVFYKNMCLCALHILGVCKEDKVFVIIFLGELPRFRKGFCMLSLEKAPKKTKNK